jgi:hypothetical protein
MPVVRLEIGGRRKGYLDWTHHKSQTLCSQLILLYQFVQFIVSTVNCILFYWECISTTVWYGCAVQF